MKKLKPVIFVEGEKKFYSKNGYAQTILLKAMSRGVTDPNELRKMAGLKSAAEVYRTLDKLAIRKEYHNALANQGVTFDKIVAGIKDICENSKTDSVKLSGYQTLLKSLGLDKYEKDDESGKSWEETIIKAIEEKEKTESESGEIIDVEVEEYEIDKPEIPKSALKRIEEEKKIADELYGE